MKYSFNTFSDIFEDLKLSDDFAYGLSALVLTLYCIFRWKYFSFKFYVKKEFLQKESNQNVEGMKMLPACI